MTKVEMRFEVHREIADVLDAVSHSRGIDRNKLLLELVHKFVDERCHEAKCINRVARGNPTLSEAVGLPPEVVAEKQALIRKVYGQ